LTEVTVSANTPGGTGTSVASNFSVATAASFMASFSLAGAWILRFYGRSGNFISFAYKQKLGSVKSIFHQRRSRIILDGKRDVMLAY
jgi:hypothetical protein